MGDHRWFGVTILRIRGVHSNHRTQMARCGELRWMALFLSLAGGLPAQPKTLIDQAFDRLYNFDFKPAQEILDRQVQLTPNDPLPLSVKAASHLFSELYRLKILELDFFTDDDKVVDRRALVPYPAVRRTFFQLVADAERLADAGLGVRADGAGALDGGRTRLYS